TLVDAAGRPTRLVGVDHAGGEYACVQGWGFFEGDTSAAGVEAIAAWHVNAAGLVVILDLHWSAADGDGPSGQRQMADADHGPRFWRSVAARFRDRRRVMFDLYNEPH